MVSVLRPAVNTHLPTCAHAEKAGESFSFQFCAGELGDGGKGRLRRVEAEAEILVGVGREAVGGLVIRSTSRQISSENMSAASSISSAVRLSPIIIEPF